MNKSELLKLIARAGYDIGFGAKKHFATFDIVEKGPGWLGFTSLVGGVYSLFVPALTVNHVAAAFVVFGVVSLYIGAYISDKQRYEEAGKGLLETFYALQSLYSTVKSMPDGSDFTSQTDALRDIRSKALKMSLSKQIFLSDWYAHYKFFAQTQVDWIDEATPFRFFRDKVPLSAYAVLVLCLAVGVYVRVSSPALSDTNASAPPAPTSSAAVR